MNWLWWRKKTKISTPEGDYGEIAKRQTRLRYLINLAEESDQLVKLRWEIIQGQWGTSPDLAEIKIELEKLRTVEGILLDGLEDLRIRRRKLIAICDRLPELREKFKSS